MNISKLGRLALLVFAGSMLAARAETIVALMSDAKLRHFSSTSPGAFIKNIEITGIPVGQTPAALDFRPDGSLVVITVQGTTLRLYTVDPNTGAAVSSPFVGIPSTTANTMAFDVFSSDVHASDLAMVTDDDSMHRFFFGSGGTGSVPTRLSSTTTAPMTATLLISTPAPILPSLPSLPPMPARGRRPQSFTGSTPPRTHS